MTYDFRALTWWGGAGSACSNYTRLDTNSLCATLQRGNQDSMGWHYSYGAGHQPDEVKNIFASQHPPSNAC